VIVPLVPFGLSTTLAITLVDGEAVTILWGWVLVSLISLSIAASLAEICAVYPTAGGVYYWSAMMCKLADAQAMIRNFVS
jgi:amino acid transporter